MEDYSDDGSILLVKVCPGGGRMFFGWKNSLVVEGPFGKRIPWKSSRMVEGYADDGRLP